MFVFCVDEIEFSKLFFAEEFFEHDALFFTADDDFFD